MSFLTIVISGSLVGLSLGLTGGGGAIFAVPLLVFAIGTSPHQAVVISLVTVAISAMVGFGARVTKKQYDLQTALLFAVSGSFGAPLGTYLSKQLSDVTLLTLFGALMLLVAFRMGITSVRTQSDLHDPLLDRAPKDDKAGPACKREPNGHMSWTSPCLLLLAGIGIGAGLLSGLFGVGGGFILVPALTSFACMDIKRAVGTSLLIIALVSTASIASQFFQGESVELRILSFFALGSLLGIVTGTAISHYLSGPTLQRVFSIAIVFVALLVISKSVFSRSIQTTPDSHTSSSIKTNQIMESHIRFHQISRRDSWNRELFDIASQFIYSQSYESFVESVRSEKITSASRHNPISHSIVVAAEGKYRFSVGWIGDRNCHHFWESSQKRPDQKNVPIVSSHA